MNMKRVLAMVLLSISTALSGCVAGAGGESGNDGEGLTAEARQAITVGTKLRLKGTIEGIPFPGSVCVGLEGGSISQTVGACTATISIDDCEWNNVTNECTCECTVTAVSSGC
jgi:hypothetical protein